MSAIDPSALEKALFNTWWGGLLLGVAASILATWILKLLDVSAAVVSPRLAKLARTILGPIRQSYSNDLVNFIVDVYPARAFIAFVALQIGLVVLFGFSSLVMFISYYVLTVENAAQSTSLYSQGWRLVVLVGAFYSLAAHVQGVRLLGRLHSASLSTKDPQLGDRDRQAKDSSQ